MERKHTTLKGNGEVSGLVAPDFEKSAEMIDEATYWKIIDKSVLQFKNYSARRNALQAELLKLEPKEIVGFELRTSKLLSISYTSELWCAAYIIKGGCSDDGFEYFRCWLISQGKDVFYKAVKDPDTLSELKKRILFDYEFEEFLYLPGYAFTNKTGKEMFAFIDGEKYVKEEGTYPQIVFNWEENNAESMKKICPKLFGKHN